MATKPRQLATLVILIVLLAVLAVAQKDRLRWSPSSEQAAASTTAARPSGPRDAATTSPQAPDDGTVRLDDLGSPRPAPEQAQRNPFRFESPRVASPSIPDETIAPERLAVPTRDVPIGPPSPPPITLKFIGLVDAPGQTARIAVLSDGRNVFHGREGDIIDGRYRILHIGAESIEMMYVDGQGRQVIRLSGGGA